VIMCKFAVNLQTLSVISVGCRGVFLSVGNVYRFWHRFVYDYKRLCLCSPTLCRVSACDYLTGCAGVKGEHTQPGKRGTVQSRTGVSTGSGVRFSLLA
jgi:hypothetical protein